MWCGVLLDVEVRHSRHAVLQAACGKREKVAKV